MHVTHTALFNRLADTIIRLPAHKPRLVAIDGRSAAGKTTLADALAAHLQQSECHVLRSSIDHFHPPGHKYRSANQQYTPQSYYAEGFNYSAFRENVLEPLRSGGRKRCRLALWDSFYDTAYPEQWTDAPDDTILVVDGAFLLRPDLCHFWDYVIWLDIDWDTMIERAAHRDVAWVGNADVVREHYRTFWIPMHQLYEAEERPMDRAHVVVGNHDPDYPYLREGRRAADERS